MFWFGFQSLSEQEGIFLYGSNQEIGWDTRVSIPIRTGRDFFKMREPIISQSPVSIPIRTGRDFF